MKQIIPIAALLSMICCLSGCAVVGGIFKAGVWVGVLAVVFVILLIVFIASRGKK